MDSSVPGPQIIAYLSLFGPMVSYLTTISVCISQTDPEAP
jgi:hypothetical protein